MEIYKFLFLTIYIIMSLFVFINQLYPVNEKKEVILIYFFGILFILLFGLRDIEVGTDTNAYFYNILALNKNNLFDGNDIGYVFVVALIFFLTKNAYASLFTIAFLYIIPLVTIYSKIEIKNKFLLFFVLVTLFSFEALGINIIRQGVAMSFSLLGFYYFYNNRKKLSLVIILIAVSFHISTTLFVGFFIISSYLKTPKIPLLVLIASSILAVLNFDIEPFLKLVPFLGSDYEDRIVNYLEFDNAFGEVYETGFRLDFFLFNWVFVIIGLLMYYFNFVQNYKFYLPVLNTFMFTSSFFFLKFNQIFSDRFGVFAWILIPFIVAPLADNKIIYGKLYIFLLCLILFILFKQNLLL